MEDDLKTSPLNSPGEMSPKDYSSGNELENSFDSDQGVKLPEELLSK